MESFEEIYSLYFKDIYRYDMYYLFAETPSKQKKLRRKLFFKQ